MFIIHTKTSNLREKIIIIKYNNKIIIKMHEYIFSAKEPHKYQ